jgi:hypothetical protein
LPPLQCRARTRTEEECAGFMDFKLLENKHRESDGTSTRMPGECNNCSGPRRSLGNRL